MVNMLLFVFNSILNASEHASPFCLAYAVAIHKKKMNSYTLSQLLILSPGQVRLISDHIGRQISVLPCCYI